MCAFYSVWFDLVQTVESNTPRNKTNESYSEKFSVVFSPLKCGCRYVLHSVRAAGIWWFSCHLYISISCFLPSIRTGEAFFQPIRNRMWSPSATTNKLLSREREKEIERKSCKLFLGCFWNLAKNVPDFIGRKAQTLSIYLNKECILIIMTLQEIDWDKNNRE